MDKEKLMGYWKANTQLIWIIMAVWFLVSYGGGIILQAVAPTMVIPPFSVPLGFWFAHQGSMIVFVVLIFIYAKMMDGIDQQYDVQE